jgi:hypothetical protein
MQVLSSRRQAGAEHEQVSAEREPGRPSRHDYLDYQSVTTK